MSGRTCGECRWRVKGLCALVPVQIPATERRGTSLAEAVEASRRDAGTDQSGPLGCVDWAGR